MEDTFAVSDGDNSTEKVYCADEDPLPCLDHLHFDTTRCLILYHDKGHSCGMTLEDLVQQIGTCAGSGSLER